MFDEENLISIPKLSHYFDRKILEFSIAPNFRFFWRNRMKQNFAENFLHFSKANEMGK